jgi:hypothetical protein
MSPPTAEQRELFERYVDVDVDEMGYLGRQTYLRRFVPQNMIDRILTFCSENIVQDEDGEGIDWPLVWRDVDAWAESRGGEL